MVSVAMCTYNGSKYIKEQLISILDQTQKIEEIVICDDNSSDNTVEIAKEVLENTDIKVKIIRNEVQKGVTKNFENALMNCTGDIIFLSDQDDVWSKNKVEIICKEMQNKENGMLFFTDAYLVDANLNKLDKSLWEKVGIEGSCSFGVLDFLGKRFVTGATVAIRKDILKYALPIPECWIHDAWLAVNAALYGKVYAIKEKTIFYRQHSSNVIGVRNKSFFETIKYRWNNLDESWKFREKMACRMGTFIEHNNHKLTTDEQLEYEKSYKFWVSTYQIKGTSILRGLKVIIANLWNGNYKKYNHGAYGALVDFCILISIR